MPAGQTNSFDQTSGIGNRAPVHVKEEDDEEVREIMEDSFLSHWSTKVRKGLSCWAAKSESDRSEDSVETFAQCSPSRLIIFWRSASIRVHNIKSINQGKIIIILIYTVYI
jgi:hypothetical protein